MGSNLLKKEIKTVSAGVLNGRYCWIMKKGEEMPAGVITLADARELVWIEEELHIRLIKLLGCDPYPPDRVEEPIPSHYMKSLLKPKPKPEPEPESLLNFKITIISSIGSKIARWNVRVASRSEADGIALNEITRRKLKKATYKIS